MRITADSTVCIGAGMCALTAPGIFDQGEEDGLVEVLDPEPPEELHAAAFEAAQICPSRAITVS